MRVESCASLIAIAGADSNALAALGAAARKHGSSCLGFHPREESMGLRPVTAVRLKCALRHDTALLILLKNFCLKASLKYSGFRQKRKGRQFSKGAQARARHHTFSLGTVQLGKEIFLPEMSRCTTL